MATHKNHSEHTPEHVLPEGDTSMLALADLRHDKSYDLLTMWNDPGLMSRLVRLAEARGRLVPADGGEASEHSPGTAEDHIQRCLSDVEEYMVGQGYLPPPNQAEQPVQPPPQDVS